MSGETWAWVAVAVVVIGVVTLVVAIRFARRLIVTRRALGQLGVDDKVAFYGALAYMIFPVDLLPDPIYLDDIGVLARCPVLPDQVSAGAARTGATGFALIAERLAIFSERAVS